MNYKTGDIVRIKSNTENSHGIKLGTIGTVLYYKEIGRFKYCYVLTQQYGMHTILVSDLEPFKCVGVIKFKTNHYQKRLFKGKSIPVEAYTPICYN